MKSDESATAATREGTKTRTAVRRSSEAHVQEPRQPIPRRSDPRTEAVVTTTKKRTQSGAVTAPTDLTAKGAETTIKSIEATGSDQNPQKSPSTAPADALHPAPTPTPTAIQRSTMTHPNHRESDGQMTKSTKPISANGSAPAATTTTCPKILKTKTPTTRPNPASATSKNRVQTTTDLLLPKPPPWKPPKRKNSSRNPSMRSPRGRNPRPKDRKSTSTLESAKRGTRRGWLEKSSGRRGRWRGRLVVLR